MYSVVFVLGKGMQCTRGIKALVCSYWDQMGLDARLLTEAASLSVNLYLLHSEGLTGTSGWRTHKTRDCVPLLGAIQVCDSRMYVGKAGLPLESGERLFERSASLDEEFDLVQIVAVFGMIQEFWV